MFTTLFVAATLTAPGAPIPKETLPNPVGQAPRILAVKANETGSVWISATVFEKRKIQTQFFVMENGKQVLKQQEQEITTSTYIQKTLGEFSGKFSTADGAAITSEQATKKVKDGATILIAPEGKPVDPSWLRTVSGGTVVMYTDELTSAHFQYGHSDLPRTHAPRLVMLGTDDKGNVRVPVNPKPGLAGLINDEMGGFQNGNMRVIRNGNRMIMVNGNFMPAEPETAGSGATKPVGPDGKKALEDIRFDAFDLSGKAIPKADALKRLKAGGFALFSGDNRFPDTEYLKAFRDDMIVLTSAEFVFAPGEPNPYDPAPKNADPAAKPAAPGVVIAAPALPVAAMKIQVVPAALPVVAPVPVVPVAPPAKAAPAEKPAEKAAPAEKPAEKAAPAAKPAETADEKAKDKVTATPVKP